MSGEGIRFTQDFPAYSVPRDKRVWLRPNAPTQTQLRFVTGVDGPLTDSPPPTIGILIPAPRIATSWILTVVVQGPAPPFVVGCRLGAILVTQTPGGPYAVRFEPSGRIMETDAVPAGHTGKFQLVSPSSFALAAGEYLVVSTLSDPSGDVASKNVTMVVDTT